MNLVSARRRSCDGVTLAKWHRHAVHLSFPKLLRVAIQENFNGFSSEFVVGNGNACQSWPNPRRNGLIVERHHGHVPADLFVQRLRAHGTHRRKAGR